MAQITDINTGGSQSNIHDYNNNTNQPENNTKTRFQIECETAISLDEAEARLLSFIRSLPWKK